MEQWIDGPVDQWTNGPMDQWTNGMMDQWTNDPKDQWIDGPMDQGTNGSSISLLRGNFFLLQNCESTLRDYFATTQSTTHPGCLRVHSRICLSIQESSSVKRIHNICSKSTPLLLFTFSCEFSKAENFQL